MKPSNDILDTLLSNEISKLDEVISVTQTIKQQLQTETEITFEESLKKRGVILKEIVEIEEQLLGKLKADGNDISYLNNNYSDKIEKIQEKISSIQQMGDEINKEFSSRKESIVKEMEQLRLGQVLPDQYKQHEHGGPSFVNIKE